MEKDVINHPEHYADTNFETIEIIEDKMTAEMFEGYLVGNILKYMTRYRKKGGLEDIKKAEWYVAKLVTLMDNKEKL